MNRKDISEEKYFLELNCKLCNALHEKMMPKSTQKDAYYQDIKKLREKEKQQLQALIQEGQEKLTLFIESCAKNHRILAEKYGGKISKEVSDKYDQGWLKRIDDTAKQIENLSHLLEEAKE
ncbi:Uncharacterised protein [Candidatus Venteria ishoeyi]|uniref:Uncharacterized protein n=2 Tax=Candidatus Venteria ishoeyi TaxID=1899563 RepID=A0A1H6FEP1_9GAMM|nr:Uncharacterised protein [Candidatus Venteria ishoeyi]